MTYQIKSIKTVELHSGVALTANLFHNNKKVAYLEDAGNGGGLRVRWAVGQMNNNPEESKKVLDFYALHAPKTHWTQEHVGQDYADSVELAIEWMIEMAQNKQLNLVGA